MRHHLAAGILLGLAWAGGVGAAETTQAQADALRQQLHGFAAGVLGPAATPPEDLLRVAPEGDHFRLSWTSPSIAQVVGLPVTVSVSVRRLDDGSWTIENLQYPNPLLLEAPLPPALRGDGPAAGDGKQRAAIAITAGQRELRGLFDPALSRSSTLQSDITDLATELRAPGMRQEVHIGRQTVAWTMTPGRDGTIDLRQLLTAEDIRVAEAAGRDPGLAYQAKSFRITLDLDHLAIGQLPALLQAALALRPATTAPDGTSGTDDGRDPAALRAMIGALRNLLSGLRLNEEMTGLHIVTAQGLRVDLDRMQIGFDLAAPQATAALRMGVLLDGLTVPDAPAAIASYLPRRIELRPVVSGLDARGLTDLAISATAPGADPAALQAELLQLLQSGDLDIGIERLALDLGPARLDGHGTLRVRGKAGATLDAEIAITGFDALASELKQRPEAQPAAPFLALARKLASPQGDHLIWHVSLDQDQNILVNGTDISKLGGKKL